MGRPPGDERTTGLLLILELRAFEEMRGEAPRMFRNRKQEFAGVVAIDDGSVMNLHDRSRDRANGMDKKIQPVTGAYRLSSHCLANSTPSNSPNFDASRMRDATVQCPSRRTRCGPRLVQ